MAYTDSLQVRYFVSYQCCGQAGPINDADSGNNAVRCPTGEQLETFGVVVSAGGTYITPPQYAVLVGKSLADFSPATPGTITLPTRSLALGERFESGPIRGSAVNVYPGGYVQVQQIQSAGPGEHAERQTSSWLGQRPDVMLPPPLVIAAVVPTAGESDLVGRNVGQQPHLADTDRC